MSKSLMKKITTKALIGKIERDSVPNKGERKLYRVFGSAMGTVTGSGTYGDYVGFRGRFRAVVIDPAIHETGATFDAAKLYLPQMATDMLLPVVENQTEGGVQFGFDIGVIKADTATGYEYTVTPIVESAPEADPLEILGGALPKLPAPKKSA